ncbi:MAG: hypothetical protein KAT44_09845, partial [Pirellulales bacterium]|nr:hypothetical protein [Pirellulales bacterium]
MEVWQNGKAWVFCTEPSIPSSPNSSRMENFNAGFDSVRNCRFLEQVFSLFCLVCHDGDIH